MNKRKLCKQSPLTNKDQAFRPNKRVLPKMMRIRETDLSYLEHTKPTKEIVK